MKDEAARPEDPELPTDAAPEGERALVAALSDSPSVSSEEPDAPPDEPDPPAAAELEQALAATLSDSPSVSSEESDTTASGPEPEAPPGPAAVSVPAAGPEPGAPPVPDGAGAPDAPPDEDDDPAPEPALGVGASLLEEGGDDFSVSSDGDDAPTATAALASREDAPGVAADGNGGPEAGPPFAEAAQEDMPPGPVAALAFAMDPDTEEALRDGLFHYTGPSPDCDEPQVWPGGLRAAIAALADGYSTRLVFVDIDGISYPAGAIHELAAVCEVGTVVIAIGSDGTAQPSRRSRRVTPSRHRPKSRPSCARSSPPRATCRSGRSSGRATWSRRASRKTRSGPDTWSWRSCWRPARPMATRCAKRSPPVRR